MDTTKPTLHLQTESSPTEGTNLALLLEFVVPVAAEDQNQDLIPSHQTQNIVPTYTRGSQDIYEVCMHLLVSLSNAESPKISKATKTQLNV